MSLESLDKFRQVVENRHEYAKNWKSETGGKVCGCICANVPEEYIYAAGLLPVRILPDPKTPETLASEHIQFNKCAMCRGSLEQGLQGQYDYLDALAYVQGCLAQSQAFSSWVLSVPLAWHYKMFQPFRQDTPDARKVYSEFFEDFRSSFEKWHGAPVSKESLAKSVAMYRENRRLLRQVYELRKKHPPLISGSDAQRMILASMLMDKKEHNDLLSQLLQDMQGLQQSGNNDRPRIMIIGSGIPPVDATELVESVGADVVVEDHCLGVRYFWGEDPDDPPMDDDPIEAIITYYHDKKPQCAYQDWNGENAQKRISQLAKEYDVQAVIWLEQIFCGTHQWEIPAEIDLFEKAGIPILRMQRGRIIPKGRFLPKVEAFLEEAKGK
jgi:benzoyl-CoA reductase subunit C